MPGPVQSVERAAAILHVLARRSSLGLMEISTALDLAKGTTHGILATLRGVGFVEQDRATGRYRLGDGLLQLTRADIDPNELRSLATNLTDTLASASGQAVRIGILTDGNVEVVHHVFRPDNSRQALQTGALLPAHATALGKVLLAYALPIDGTDPAVGGEAYTRRTITDPDALRRALTEVRAKGWADEMDEYRPGESAIAAPLRITGGLVVGAVGINGPTDQVCGSPGQLRQALVKLVRDTAGSVSRELGAPR
jgi:DNA-binding IclR family transcriptional regulator